MMTDKKAKELSDNFFDLTKKYQSGKISISELIRSQEKIYRKLEKSGFIYLNGLNKFVKVL
jgi:hypothetical protein